MTEEGWGFADVYGMDDVSDAGAADLADVSTDDWRNILVLGRATGRTVYPETLSLVGHARHLADQLGCRVEVLLIGEDVQGAVDTVKEYAVDNVYTVAAPDYAPIQQTAKILAEVVKKRRPELVLVFQSRSGDAITAYAASVLGVGHVIGATQVDIDTTERLAVAMHQGSNQDFQIRTQMLQPPQFVSVQRGLFRAPMEDPYATTQVHALDIEVGRVGEVRVVEQLPAPARTIRNASRVVVVGSRIRDAADLEAARKLAATLDAAFGVTQSVVDRGLASDDDAVVGRWEHHIKPKLLLAVGNTGSLEFLDGVEGNPTIVAVASGGGDPINDRSAYRVAGSVQDAIKEILDGL